MKYRIPLLAIFLLLALNCPVLAADQTYFSALPDIPLMAGMEEVEDQTFVFDKAEGRVIGTAGFLSQKTDINPLEFYSKILEELGWRPLKTGVFVRNGEQLNVNIETFPQGILVKLQVSPQHP